MKVHLHRQLFIICAVISTISCVIFPKDDTLKAQVGIISDQADRRAGRKHPHTNAAPIVQQDPVEQKQIVAQKDWTIFLYIQARNNLAPFAIRNLKEITDVGPGEKVNVVVQWEQPHQKGVWRYIIEKDRIVLLESDETDHNIDPAKRLVDFIAWGAKRYPSKKTAVILWNHGIGALDPTWGNPMRFLVFGDGKHNPRLDIEGVTYTSSNIEQEESEEGNSYQTQQSRSAKAAKDRSDLSENEHRGLLFDELYKIYMTNKDLGRALRGIYAVLGKKIDVLGMDTCFSQMMEPAYLAKDFAHYYVASQDIELARGWPYDEIMKALQNDLSPRQLAETIVQKYEQLYRGKTHLFTLSAIDLSKIMPLKQNIDSVAQHLIAAMSAERGPVTSLIRRSRKETLEFSTPLYVDLHSFYLELSNNISAAFQNRMGQGLFPSLAHRYPNRIISSISRTPLSENLLREVQSGINLINQAVFAKTSSQRLGRSQGISIYFPQYGLDDSYINNEFAQQSTWTQLINVMLQS